MAKSSRVDASPNYLRDYFKWLGWKS